MDSSKFLRLNLPELKDSADIRKLTENFGWLDDFCRQINDLYKTINTKLDVALTEVDDELANKASKTELTESLSEKANVVDVNSALSEKVSKESGKGLSTNDYTDVEKAKVANVVSETSKLNGYFTLVQ